VLNTRCQTMIPVANFEVLEQCPNTATVRVRYAGGAVKEYCDECAPSSIALMAFFNGEHGKVKSACSIGAPLGKGVA